MAGKKCTWQVASTVYESELNVHGKWSGFFLVEETLSSLVPKTEFSLQLVETLASVTYIVLFYRLFPPSLSQTWSATRITTRFTAREVQGNSPRLVLVFCYGCLLCRYPSPLLNAYKKKEGSLGREPHRRKARRKARKLRRYVLSQSKSTSFELKNR